MSWYNMQYEKYMTDDDDEEVWPSCLICKVGIEDVQDCYTTLLFARNMARVLAEVVKVKDE